MEFEYLAAWMLLALTIWLMAGVYRHPAADTVWSLSMKDGDLVVDSNRPRVLTPLISITDAGLADCTVIPSSTAMAPCRSGTWRPPEEPPLRRRGKRGRAEPA